ncbi:GGDEF domain-containing protein [Deinococcus navajonensis]|uniref:GGDEF domain-containing protein n=1 Tax=Deinococcus navajonensis TaxID=309884 RepID=A0ABV8XK42_9DEIO
MSLFPRAEALSPQDAFRCHALIILLACSAAAAVCSLILTPLVGLQGLDTVGPILIFVKSVLFVAWVRRRPEAFRLIGMIELCLEVVTGAVKLTTVLHVDQLSYGLGGYLNWLPLIYVLAALLVPGRWGLPVSLGIYGVLLVPGIAFGLSPQVPAEIKTLFGNTVVQMYILHAAFIAFFALLGQALEAYTRAEGQAELQMQLANSDALTGLPNRRQLSVWLERASAPGAGAGCVLLFDLDHFKVVNDTYGHDVGDEVLLMTATCAREAMREGDLLGRWGGEEFMAILPGCSLSRAELVASRLQAGLHAAPHPVAGVVTVSCGLAELRPGEDPRTLLRRADAALYSAKREGRDIIRISA